MDKKDKIENLDLKGFLATHTTGWDLVLLERFLFPECDKMSKEEFIQKYTTEEWKKKWGCLRELDAYLHKHHVPIKNAYAK